MRNLHVVAAAVLGLTISQPAFSNAAYAHGKEKGHSHGHKHDHSKEAGHTQLDAHEHGSGKLNVAIQGATVAIELEVPAADIVGFEHAAKTKAQKAQLKEAKAKLAKPLALFVMNASAGCKVTEADIEAEGALAGDEHDHGHKHDHGKKEAHAEETHSEFHANYVLTCATPSEINQIEFAFFKSFPNSKELDVSVVGDRGALKFEASRDASTLSLPASS
jgi:hypothetical protein